MAQTRAGAVKIAAKRAGVSLAEYQRRVGAGEKWCTGCRAWHRREAFGVDKSRGDGLAAVCIALRSVVAKARYVKRARPSPGRNFVPPRDGDKRQARRRINHFVEIGLIVSPKALPCADCGHIWTPGGRRHEYDHWRGYAAEHHEHVQAVCSRCHSQRERDRARGRD